MYKGKTFIISGPSGVGKSTVLKELFQDRDDLYFSVSATTRPPRPGEIDGVHYHFTDVDEFRKMISEDAFLEYAEYVGNFYGTPKKFVDEAMEQGKDVVLDIEVQGALQVVHKRPDVVRIFIAPPSWQALEERLTSRGTDSPEKVQKRLVRAKVELQTANTYDYFVINDTVERAVREINAWASEKTHGKIEKIISDSNFAALLANAVYFKGSWYSSFYERNTKNEIFTDTNGQKKEISFLEDNCYWAGYSENDDCKLVKIGYHTGASERQVSMVIVLPNEGVALNSIRLSEQIQNADWKNEHVSIKLPKFHIESSFDLTDSLKSLGIKKAFDKDKADFSPMFGAKFAYLDTILQNTYIHVDENGTEAAAVTSSGSGGGGPAPFKPIPFVADHPFYFAIVDEINNEMLFAGQFAYAE